MANPPVSTTPRRAAPRVQFKEAFFAYAQSFASIAPGATQNQSIQVQADSAFRWTKLTAMANIANAAYDSASIPIPLCNLQITDSGTGRQLFSTPISLQAIAGSGQLPFILPVPYLFMPRSAINLALTNADAAVTYNIQLALLGSKIFDFDANQIS
jgi:hypothetical protein